jgi:hypothetical protein
MNQLPKSLKFKDMPEIAVQWHDYKETIGKGDAVYTIWIPVLPAYATGRVKAPELASFAMAECAGKYLKLSSDDLSRLEVSNDEVALASTFASLRGKLDSEGRIAEDEPLMELSEKVVGGKLFPGTALQKLEEISEAVTEEDVLEEAPSEDEDDTEPITARTLKRILAEREQPSWKSKAPTDMNKEELAEFRKAKYAEARQLVEDEHAASLKSLPANKTKEELDDEDPSPFQKSDSPIQKSPLDMNASEMKAFRDSHLAAP